MIFAVHLFTLALLLVVGLGAVMTHGLDVFFANMETPPPGGFAMALFFGFSASMLGISGFESSANFVEEQQPGVFPKTLRNMWIAVSFFNPVMALLVLGLVEIPAVGEHKEALLAHVGAGLPQRIDSDARRVRQLLLHLVHQVLPWTPGGYVVVAVLTLGIAATATSIVLKRTPSPTSDPPEVDEAK